MIGISECWAESGLWAPRIPRRADILPVQVLCNSSDCILGTANQSNILHVQKDLWDLNRIFPHQGTLCHTMSLVGHWHEDYHKLSSRNALPFPCISENLSRLPFLDLAQRLMGHMFLVKPYSFCDHIFHLWNKRVLLENPWNLFQF